VSNSDQSRKEAAVIPKKLRPVVPEEEWHKEAGEGKKETDCPACGRFRFRPKKRKALWQNTTSNCREERIRKGGTNCRSGKGKKKKNVRNVGRHRGQSSNMGRLLVTLEGEGGRRHLTGVEGKDREGPVWKTERVQRVAVKFTLLRENHVAPREVRKGKKRGKKEGSKRFRFFFTLCVPKKKDAYRTSLK